MKKNVRKLIVIILSCILLLGTITKCGVEEKNTDTTSNEVETQKSNGDADTQGNEAKDIVELDIFINESWWPIDTFTGIIPEAIQEATGVKLNVTVAADQNQLGLMIASNELPDLIFTASELNRLSSKEFCYSYNELIDTYEPDYKFNELQQSIAKSFSTDENYYCILNNFNTSEDWEKATVAPGQACVYYRKDMYEAMGSPKLKTPEDFLDVCEQVKQKYANKIPLGLGGVWKLQAFSSWLGSAGSNIYQYLEDGTVVHKTSVPEYKDYLKYANTMARKGYITSEAYANTNEADATTIPYNDESFAFSWYLTPNDLNNLNTQTQKVNKEAQWVPLEVLGGENTNYGTGKGWCGLFISRNCKEVEAATKLVTFLFSEEGRRLSKWGREGIDYTMDADGTPKWSEDWIETSKDPGKMNQKYNQFFYFGCTSIEDLLPGYAGLDSETRELFATYKNNYKSYPEIGIATPVSTSEEGIIEAKLTEMLLAEEAKVIFSESDEEFENSFTKLQQNCNKIGVQQLNEYMTQKVNEVKKEFGF